MAFDVIVPEVGEVGMEVVFVRWLKADGDQVAVGEPLFEVDTEKSVMEVEAYAAGTLTDLAVGEGDTIQTRQIIARILVPGEDLAISAAPSSSQIASPPPSGSSGIVESSSAIPETRSASTPADEALRRPAGVSPRARRVARELGVGTEGLVGSGPDGLITETDVRAAAQDSGDSEPAAALDPADRARRAIADLTTRSWQTIPHFYLQLEADVERGLELAKPTPLICASVAQALARHPECNLGWEGDTPLQRSSVDLGLLVDAPVGLLIAVVTEAQDLGLGAQDLGLGDMAEALAAAADRARSGKLSAADLGARSLTVSNLGMYAVDRFAAVIPKPDVLTLAVGRTRTAPRWDGSAFTPRKVVDLTLSVDHRALDGAAAARFLSTLESVLADPIAEGLA